MSQLALIPTDGSFVAGNQPAPEPERVLLDSLPYVDPFDEDDRRRAEELIRLELLKFAPPNYQEGRPEHKIEFSTEIMQKTWAEMEKSGNYGIPALESTNGGGEVRPPEENYRKNIGEWVLAVNNAKRQFVHQDIKFENLELQQQFGANAWIKHNEFLETYRKSLEKQLKALQEDREELNRQRKQEQSQHGSKIHKLEAQWHELIARNLQAEAACLALEDEVNQLSLRVNTDQNGKAAASDAMDTS